MSAVYLTRSATLPGATPAKYHWTREHLSDAAYTGAGYGMALVRLTNCGQHAINPATARDAADVATARRCRAPGCRSGWPDWMSAGEGAA